MAKVPKSDILKRNLLEALEKSLGIVTTACKSVGCSRKTFYQYCAEDEEFKKNVEDVGDIALDFAESQLHKQIRDGVPSSTMFYLKTKGKKRGYIESSNLNIGGQEDKPVQITGVNIIRDK